MASRQKIFSVSQFMPRVLADSPTVKYLRVYFFRAKAQIIENNDWSDKPFSECYIRPVKILLRMEDGFKNFGLENFNSLFGPDWGIKFRISRTRRLVNIHDINCLEIQADTKSMEGISYYPSQIRMLKEDMNYMNKLAEKYNDEKGFEFRKGSHASVEEHDTIPEDDAELL